jgi:hypothetical protein
MAKIVRMCPRCYEQTGDTYEFDKAPPVGVACDECGARLQPMPPPEDDGREGWLGDRDYSERYNE